MQPNVDLKKYIYWNYISKQIAHVGKGRIIPYKNAVIDLASSSRIYVGDHDIHIGTNKLKGSRQETCLRLRNNSAWHAEGYCEIAYGCTIEILNNACLKTQHFSMNSNSTMICADHIEIGDDVMIGRNVTIYDSNFHTIYNADGQEKTKSKPITIGNHVWVGTGATILKGVHLDDGSIVAAESLIIQDVAPNSLTGNVQMQKVLEKNISWKR